MGYLVNPIPKIVTARVFLTQADLLTPGFTIDPPEFAAVPGYFWKVIGASAQIVNGSTPYVGTSVIHIQAKTSNQPQFRIINTYMQSPVDTWNNVPIVNGNDIQYVVNDYLQVENNGTLTLGDTELNIFISAILIQY
jgi:hypothetical protein